MTREIWRLLLLLGGQALVILALLALALDVRAHARVEDLGGVNIWGYRGPVAHQRQPNEIRIAIAGGTRAFGWGEPASALASQVRRIVLLTTDRPGRPLRPVVVINLGRMSALPSSYPERLAHYAYLRPDYICLYDDLGVAGGPAWRSGVYERTGYEPILPLVLREKGRLHGGVAGAVLARAGETLGAADAWFARRRPAPDESPDAYADQMLAAVEAARRGASKGVVLVLSPADLPEQAARRAALVRRLDQGRPAGSLRVVDLGTDAPLASPDMRLDGWNFASAGIERVAELIAPALVSLITADPGWASQ
jgi:hypothetical protein